MVDPERIEFDWDEPKRKANLKKHGIDFQGAIRVFWRRSVDFSIRTAWRKTLVGSWLC